MTKILVTGAGGQLGAALVALSQSIPQWNWVCPNRETLDISDYASVKAFFAEHQPTYCINTAAYTAVDKAESEVDEATAANVQAVIHLAEMCKLYGTHLFHFSTDYVYSDNYNRPLLESDATAPKGVYAETKLAGEKHALEILDHSTIIRTSWVYSDFGHNFVKTMLRLGKERPRLNVVFDQIGSPTYAHDLAKACTIIISKLESGEIDVRRTSGIFNYSNEGVTSWYDFALAIFELSGINCQVKPIESSAYPTPASRPHFSVLNKNKFKENFGIDIPYWRESLVECLNKLGENN